MQGCIKAGAVSVGFVLNHGSGQLVFARKLQTTRIGLVADNGSYPCAIALLPVVALGGFDDGSHVGAAARDEDDDVALGHALHFMRRDMANFLVLQYLRRS